MDALLKLWKVRNDDVVGLRKLYDKVESHVRSLKTLGINMDGHSALISTVLLQKLPNDIRLIVNRNIKETWDLTKILKLANQELGAREACIAPKRSQDGKNGFENTEGLQYTGSSLHLGTRSTHQSKSDLSLKKIKRLKATSFIIEHGN